MDDPESVPDPEPVRKVLASNVRRLRHNADMTQAALGARSGKGRNYIASLEIGRIPTPSAAALYDVARALGVSMETLMGRPELPCAPADMTLAEAQTELERRLDVIGLQPFVGMDAEQFRAYMPDTEVSREGMLEAAGNAVRKHLHYTTDLPPEWAAVAWYSAGVCAMALVARNFRRN